MAKFVNRFAFPALLVAVAMATPGLAEEPRDNRFTMTPTDGGFVRLDTRTGEMAICQRSDAQWACTPMDDVATKMRDELQALRRENELLRDEITRLEAELGTERDSPGGPPPRAERTPVPGLNLPSEAEVDRALDYFGNILKKFQDQIRKLEETPGASPKAPQEPDTEAAPEDGRRAL